MIAKRSVTPCMTMLLLLTAGCSAQDRNTTHKAEPEANRSKSLEKVIINGSPVPPKGYERPVVKRKENNQKKE